MFKKVFLGFLFFFFASQASAFEITSLTPDPASNGEIVTVQGKDMGEAGTIMLNNTAITPLDWTTTQIQFTVPSGAVTGTLTLLSAQGVGVSVPFTVRTSTGPLGITSMSTNSFTEGTLVDIYGNGFGSQPGINSQVCFSETLCSAVGALGQVVISWTDTKIQIQIPKLPLPVSGTLMVSVFPGVSTTPVWYSGGTYTFFSMKPLISQVSPGVITPESTLVTIRGTSFGERYVMGKTQICINGGCLNDEYIQQYILYWSPSEIQMKLPVMGQVGPSTLTLNIWKYVDLTTGSDVYFPVNYAIELLSPQEPTIDSVVPLTIIPETTVMTITGRGFESTYLAGKHQICFQDACIRNEYIPLYVLSWSDREIQLKVPGFVDNYENPELLLRLYSPSVNSYVHMKSSALLKVQHRPAITQYYPKMENSALYTVYGKYFGILPGRIMIAGKEQSILKWTDTAITYKTSDEALDGTMIIYTSDLIASSSVRVNVEYTPVYSKDMFSKFQWYFQTLSVKDAWALTEGSSSVIVAVIDSGVDMTHPELEGKMWTNGREIPGNGKDDDNNGYVDDGQGWNFTENSTNMTPLSPHGTMVASVIGGKKDNEIGGAGIAPGVKIMPLLVMSKGDFSTGGNYINVDAAVKAVKYAVDNGAHVINLSFGGPYTDAFREVFQYAYDNNVFVVSAAGNEGLSLSQTKMSPICNNIQNNEVLGIAALTKSLTLAPFSNYGGCIDFALPGTGIIVATPASESGELFNVADGTSFAAPLLSGMVALMRSYHPDWNVEELKAALFTTSLLLDNRNPAYPGALGKGLPNAYLALSTNKPKVSYAYKPRSQLQFTPTNEVIVVESPEVNPIGDFSSGEVEQNALDAEGTSSSIFLDVSTDHPYATPIAYLKQRDVLGGYPDGTFRPESSVNRAEFLKIILESAKVTISEESYRNCFPDVKKEWFAKYVCFAKSRGIIDGYPDGTFRPGNTINKVETLKILAKAFALSSPYTKSSFEDVPENAWFTPFVRAAEDLNLLEEEGRKNYEPGALMKRGALSEILFRYLYMKERDQSTYTGG